MWRVSHPAPRIHRAELGAEQGAQAKAWRLYSHAQAEAQ